MSLHCTVLSLEPMALGAVLGGCTTADAVLLDLGVVSEATRRLVFRVHGCSAAPSGEPGDIRVLVEDTGHVIAGNGGSEVVEPAALASAELLAETFGELRLIAHGRVRLVASVRLRACSEADLSFRRIRPDQDEDAATRPTCSSTRVTA